MTTLTKTETKKLVASASQPRIDLNPGSDELTIRMSSSHHQQNAMPVHLREQKRKEELQLIDLFNQTLADKGELNQAESHWIGPDELEVDGVSKMALHSFLLKAEELGKDITYTNTLTVKIADSYNPSNS